MHPSLVAKNPKILFVLFLSKHITLNKFSFLLVGKKKGVIYTELVTNSLFHTDGLLEQRIVPAADSNNITNKLMYE